MCELDGTVFDWLIAAFGIIPYHACKSITLPDIALDISTVHLQEMKESMIMGADNEDMIDDKQNEVTDIVNEETDNEDMT